MKKLFLSSLLVLAINVLAVGDCCLAFVDLGETYSVQDGLIFNQQEDDYLIGTLNIAGTYNHEDSHLYINNLNVSGTFNNNGGVITGSNGWYYDNFDITVAPAGRFNQHEGIIWHFVDVFTNQGIFEATGGSLYGITTLQNEGDLVFYGGDFLIMELVNDGTMIAGQRSYAAYDSYYRVGTLINNGTVNAAKPLSIQYLRNAGSINLTDGEVRKIDTVENNGKFSVLQTPVEYVSFHNYGDFMSHASINVFTDLLLHENSRMQGSGEDRWFISGSLSGVKLANNTVTNITGSMGMCVYYSTANAENAYLRGKSYKLTGGGKLLPASSMPSLVEIDLMPGINPNEIKLFSKELVCVAIMAQAPFDTRSIDPATVTLSGAEQEKYVYEDLNTDGYEDLLCYFNIKKSHLSRRNTIVILSGKTFNGAEIAGMDTASIAY